MLRRIPFPEVVIGLVAPVGVDLSPTRRALADLFRKKDYEPFFVKVTDVFPVLHRKLKGNARLSSSGYFGRISSYIAFGDELRERFDEDAILAASAIFEIARKRRDHFKNTKPRLTEENYERRVFIVDQLKRPEEVNLLRDVYGPLFFQVSVYARRETRVKHIAARIVKDMATIPGKTPESMAFELVADDENEASKPHGQRVRKTFHTADFIVNIEVSEQPIHHQLERFCELIFGSNRVSPTKTEYGMFAAKASALRTLDLSRQVGAAIFTDRGEIIAMGSNEVPKAGGGTYWSDEPGFDAREYTREGDINDDLKSTVAREFFEIVKEHAKFEGTYEEFASVPRVKDSRVMDALEYGRVVHAEMSALMDAARRGSAVHGSILYTTTFPCHMCAKHIVASGIAKVVYLEPYPKNLVAELHLDSVSIDSSDRGLFTRYEAVDFEHFYGVTPRRYRELFERGRRKNAAGRFQEYIGGEATPIMSTFRPTYAKLEHSIIGSGLAALDRLTSLLDGGAG